jgi:hypothetical protein
MGVEMDQAVEQLREAHADYERERSSAADRLSRLQERREVAMRRVAALGATRRQIGEMTGLSHTRVNQILTQGRQAVPDAHLAPGIAEPPPSTDRAIVRVLGTERRVWTRDEIAGALAQHGWPDAGLDDALAHSVTRGQVLVVDGPKYTVFSDLAG